MAEEREILLVGLGNPGKKYEFTRHNLGFLVLKALAHQQRWTFKEEKRFHGHLAKGRMEGKEVALLLPDTFMNESGRAVQAYAAYYKLQPQDILVISDDIHLAYGSQRLRPEGSAGGHNGLKSIETHLGSRQYPRLRMGIGRGAGAEPLVDYVLDLFSQEELAELPHVLERGIAALKQIVAAADLTEVMSSVNVKRRTKA